MQAPGRIDKEQQNESEDATCQDDANEETTEAAIEDSVKDANHDDLKAGSINRKKSPATRAKALPEHTALEQRWWVVRDGTEVVGPQSESRKATPSSGCVSVSPSTKVINH